jgi:hypothetical protein
MSVARLTMAIAICPLVANCLAQQLPAWVAVATGHRVARGDRGQVPRDRLRRWLVMIVERSTTGESSATPLACHTPVL